jgi:methanogenic corrinoid protein MtbC1/DNA-binding XRE family transcriptional regulator
MNSFRPLKVRGELQENLETPRREYARALAAGDAEAAHQVIADLMTRRCSLGDIYSHVIAPALASIGDLWCRKDIGVAEEHLATQLVLGHLDRLSSMFAWRDRLSSYRILVGCVEGERHWVGARMFADLCLSHGWSGEFLGPDVPESALIDIVKKREPHVVALSATMTPGVERTRKVAGALAKLAKPPRIILGGQAIVNHRAQTFTSACTIATDAVAGVEIALKFLRANRPKVVLKQYLSALGARVRELRLKRGWTQEQLADGARVTRVCIVAVEGGKQNVSMDIVVRVANALGVSPQALLSDGGATDQV